MKILFICRSNIGRSQMAEAFFNKLSKKNKSFSAGIYTNEHKGKKLSNIGKKVVKCMANVGYNISNRSPKQIKHEMIKTADKIIVMADKKLLPDYLRDSDKVTYWNVKDPKQKSYNFHVKIRNKIKSLVKKLIKEMG